MVVSNLFKLAMGNPSKSPIVSQESTLLWCKCPPLRKHRTQHGSAIQVLPMAQALSCATSTNQTFWSLAQHLLCCLAPVCACDNYAFLPRKTDIEAMAKPFINAGVRPKKNNEPVTKPSFLFQIGHELHFFPELKCSKLFLSPLRALKTSGMFNPSPVDRPNKTQPRLCAEHCNTRLDAVGPGADVEPGVAGQRPCKSCSLSCKKSKNRMSHIMCICMYVCMYICIYIYICVCVSICTYIYIYTYKIEKRVIPQLQGIVTPLM